MENKEYEIVSIHRSGGDSFPITFTFDSLGHCIDRTDDKSIISATRHLSSMIADLKRGTRLVDYIYVIHSIRRLSDGQEFTVGNTYTTQSGTTIEIESFDISGDRYKAYPIIITAKNSSGYYTLDFLIGKKPITTLFISEDGAEVLSDYNKPLYLVENNKLLTITNNLTQNYAIRRDKENCKWFVSEIAAREYLIFNSPCISIMDLVGEHKDKLPIFNLSSKKRNEIAKNLYNIVKTRI